MKRNNYIYIIGDSYTNDSVRLNEGYAEKKVSGEWIKYNIKIPIIVTPALKSALKRWYPEWFHGGSI